MQLFAEAATLAPDVALRRFVENALGAEPPDGARRRALSRCRRREPARSGRLAGAGGRAAWAFQGVDGAIAAPTLVLTGTEDNVVDPRNAECSPSGSRARASSVSRAPGTSSSGSSPTRSSGSSTEFLQ